MTFHIAIAGTGGIADDQLGPALGQVEDAQLWSVLSRGVERGREFADRHGAQAPNPVHTTIEALLSDPELDAIIIATPDKLHVEQTLAAASAGKHVLVEKPMATDVEEAKAMVKACHDANVQLGVGYHLRWHNGHRKLLETIRAGELGQLRHMRVLWTSRSADASNWRASPEVGRWWSLAAFGTHCLDMIRWIMLPQCGEVVSLRSMISRDVWKGPHDETALVSFRLRSGATAEFCSSILFDSLSRVEVYGSKGYAVAEETLGRHGGGSVRTHLGELKFSITNPFVGEVTDFVAAIREQRQPEVDGNEGLRNVELLVRAASPP
jgi:1,5-anhydro-D-fructose reductase (1,5-anhydro-D-mannitol-forming)